MQSPKIAFQDRLHSADSAADLLGIRPSTIRWYWTTGKLHRVKIGRLTRVRESELLALIGSASVSALPSQLRGSQSRPTVAPSNPPRIQP